MLVDMLLNVLFMRVEAVVACLLFFNLLSIFSDKLLLDFLSCLN